jgi:hypothetical protein
LVSLKACMCDLAPQIDTGLKCLFKLNYAVETLRNKIPGLLNAGIFGSLNRNRRAVHHRSFDNGAEASADPKSIA